MLTKCHGRSGRTALIASHASSCRHRAWRATFRHRFNLNPGGRNAEPVRRHPRPGRSPARTRIAPPWWSSCTHGNWIRRSQARRTQSQRQCCPGPPSGPPLEPSKPTAPAMATRPGFRQNGCGAPPKSSNPVSHGPRIMRELGVPEAAALKAHENCKMPPNINPAAAARFVTLPALRSRGLTSGHRSPRCSARPLGRHRCRYRKQNQCRRRLGIALRPRCPAQSRRSLRSQDKVSSRTSTVAPSLSMIETRKGLPHGNAKCRFGTPPAPACRTA